MSTTDRIRRKVRDRDYYLSAHAEEEMADDNFERRDIEHAMLRGVVEKRLTDDLRGVRYRVEGPALDGRLMHVVCRYRDLGDLIVITVYEIGAES